MEKRKFLTFGLIAILVLGAVVLVSLPTSNADSEDLTSHDPISIEHDGDITAANGVANPDAAGTEEDPYIIENWSIDASSTHGIEITYTTKHFIIRNCEIKNGQNTEEDLYNNGIYIHTLQSGYCIVENNQLTKDNGGVVFEKASNCISRNNVFNDNGGNMRISDCKDIIIENNQAEDGGDGFYLDNVSDSTLTGNVVDGTYKPAYALYRSSSCVIDGNTANDSEGGVYLYHSYDNTIKNNDIKECWSYGFATQDAPEGGQPSNNNQIYNNYFINNGIDKGVTQAYDKYTNYWSVGNFGNYWSDWQPPEHPDSNGDGVVDEDRPISGGFNEDNKPLVLPEGYFGDEYEDDSENGDNQNESIDAGDGSGEESAFEGLPNILITVLILIGGLAISYPIYKKTGKKVAVVVIVIALVAGLGFFIFSMDNVDLSLGDGENNGSSSSGETGTTTNLPVYPGASEESVSSEVETALIYGCGGVPRDIYTSDGSLEDLKSWYQSQMSNNGWGLSMEGDYEYDYKSKWYKDDKIATVWILSQDGLTAQEMYYGVEIDLSGTVIVLSSWSEGDCDF